ncbi:MAG: DUF29 family protein [Desulfamplus sp.]|nr:DUF29 family protein [Desulfamplus sp.]
MFARAFCILISIEEKITDAYTDAIEYAALETGLFESDFPQSCPYTLEQAFDKTYYPESDL